MLLRIQKTSLFTKKALSGVQFQDIWFQSPDQVFDGSEPHKQVQGNQRNLVPKRDQTFLQAIFFFGLVYIRKLNLFHFFKE